MIQSPGKYYLFSLVGLTNTSSDFSKGSLFYSVVDANLDKGSGAIVTGQKNIALHRDTLSESMIAIPGNDCDFWLLVHRYQKEEFIAYHITRAGIDPSPVVSNTGGGMSSFNYLSSYLAVSSDRGRIAMSGGTVNNSIPYVLLGRFDPNTGKVSNPLKVAVSATALCFSPNSERLFFCNGRASAVSQLDIRVYDSLTIKNSLKNIVTTAAVNSIRSYNDTVYFKQLNAAASAIGRINRPNLAGDSSNMEMNIATWKGGSGLGIGLGNDVAYPMFRKDTLYTLALDTPVCGFDKSYTLKAPSGYDSHVWDNGSTDSLLNVNEFGVYRVFSKSLCENRVDSFIVKRYDILPPVITISVHELSTTQSYNSYQWMLNGSVIPGATNPTYSVAENGSYQVIITNVYGCTDTSDVYKVTNIDETAIADKSTLSQQIVIYPNPAFDQVTISSTIPVSIRIYGIEGRLVDQQQRAETFSIANLPAGVYWISMYDEWGAYLKTEKLVKQ